MSPSLTVRRIAADQGAVLRELRTASLREAPYAFGETLEDAFSPRIRQLRRHRHATRYFARHRHFSSSTPRAIRPVWSAPLSTKRRRPRVRLRVVGGAGRAASARRRTAGRHRQRLARGPRRHGNLRLGRRRKPQCDALLRALGFGPTGDRRALPAHVEVPKACSCATCRPHRRYFSSDLAGHGVSRSLRLRSIHGRMTGERRHASPSCHVMGIQAARAGLKKFAPLRWTPVKYAKFFAERYVAQEIALFRTPQRLCRYAPLCGQDNRPRRDARRTDPALRGDPRIFR